MKLAAPGIGPLALVAQLIVQPLIAVLPKIARVLLPSLLQGWDLAQPTAVNIIILAKQVSPDRVCAHVMPAAVGMALVRVVLLVAVIPYHVQMPLLQKPEQLKEPNGHTHVTQYSRQISQ